MTAINTFKACALTVLIIACFVFSIWIGADQIGAQNVTPTYFTAIAGPFDFLYAYPNQIGWSSAEDKRGDPYIKGYKVDVDRNRADCLHWTAVGAFPAAQLSMFPACSGGTRLGTGIYWFDAPSIATPTLMPTATGFQSPSPSPSASMSATLTPTPTPSPFPISKTSTPTPAPIGTPKIIWGNMCNPDPTPEYPRSVTIYGGTFAIPFLTWYCQPNVTPDAIYSVPLPTFQAAWDAGGRELIRAAAELAAMTPTPTATVKP